MLQPFWYETTYYYRGLALMKMGQNNDATGQLKSFLRNMKNADAELPEVADAVRKLKIIRNRP